MTENTLTHRIRVDAPPAQVYTLIADVGRWPLLLTPTVHAEQLHRHDDEELIQLWATANGGLTTWQSRRVLTPQTHTIEFAQVKFTAPVASMRGRWDITAAGPHASQVTLHHTFSAVDDDPAAVALIGAAVNHNSTQELARIKQAAEHAGTGLAVSFDDSVEFTGSLERAYEFIHRSDAWPDRLPHVGDVDLTEYGPDLQTMTMTTIAADGSEHRTTSGRVCRPAARIFYKQYELPPVMLAHTGRWIFEQIDPATVKVTSHHDVIVDMTVARSIYGVGLSDADAARMVRDTLGGNSRITLSATRDWAANRKGTSAVPNLTVTEDDLKTCLQQAVGGDDDIDIDTADLDTDLVELGIDSLAKIDALGRLERQFGFRFPEGSADVIDTIRNFLTVANEQLAGQS
ncbi:SRPBCC family protein [Nocardia alba]|uniref:Aromatase n=1 Tax=Nocardia alba TaxID=225051 RepID=A0A4R1FB09_9NOCA|nr:SRPBCC family protein [Nocardia alba]TCJ89879.1 aromatase [Nocardia alba]